MIKVLNHKIEPTIFPDDTTQVWKLPSEILSASEIKIDWRFENEAELLWLAQVKMLLQNARSFSLHVPYLPYARQDKEVSNDLTFALHSFAALLNGIGFDTVTAVDVHNPAVTKALVKNFRNIPVDEIHKDLAEKLNADFLIFPDAGALERYLYARRRRHIVFEKERDQATGKITGHRLVPELSATEDLNGKRLLIVDDICDGGATFISIAKAIAAKYTCRLDLFVTHGLFSKGRGLLEKAGLRLHTTNSLMRNPDGIPV